MNFKNKIIYFVMISLTINGGYAFAEKSNSIKDEINENKDKIQNLEDEKSNINNKIQEKQKEIDNLQNTITEKENELYNIQKKISDYQKEIDNIQIEITKLSSSIKESKLEVENRERYILELKKEEKSLKELLDYRIRSVYKVDLSKQYIYMILKSKNIFDMFQNLGNIKRIVNFDKSIIKTYKENQQIILNEVEEIKIKIKQQEEAQNVIEEKQKEIINAKDKVVSIQKEEENKKNELLVLQRDNKNIVMELEENNEKINEKIDEIEQHNKELEAELDRIINNVSGNVENVPTESGFLRPISGRITSNYGYRINPVTGEYKLHKGIDYAGNYGDSIKASKSGIVEYSGWISGYGNTIILGHGNGVQTLYPHAQTLNVNVGDKVSQGEIIATVGSTGNSTGPHLHFEIRINGQPVDPLNYIPY